MVAAQNKAATRVAAVVPFYGPFDLEALAAAARQATPSASASRGFADLVGAVGMDDKAYYTLIRKASPINYVRQGIPPFLLIHGTADKTVPYSESPNMCEKIKSVGGICEVFTVEGADHGIGKWESNPAFQAYKTKMIDWLTANLRAR
jgi:alpha-L-fucosidase 2